MKQSFDINVNELTYSISTDKDVDSMCYEVFTKCEKLFTLKKSSDGSWKTNEEDIIPISENLVEEIGDAIERHLMFKGSR
ncbi:MAG: hypothetical protein ABJB05_01910 [Parafilimonas sp.]